ncbi:MAG: bifunctional helix-turn-helix domain-containing protein/methylated-DNA--[protein]-cysteine S-methyltransferase [Alphaproteobacteria bacterium]|nr:bifunctional helix-turn-helix domain-containing protein/methylated-DNA--[protein]-cysteine S-methyltransferase [Alphaproteobacteria bacterium]MDE2109623.1 bifunctional helix-turn-helix domain-containing protein/methylated-DNA--[protein]-cysteine S-methyltransferase [Alphaproteobacteria bacterium]
MNRMIDIGEGTAQWRRMGRAIRFLSEHYLDQPRLEEAASVAGLSPFHFQREFSRYVGVSPKSFVGHLTLGHAKAELAQGASVLDAALDAGLSGPSRLHDLCLKIEAMTPGDYAKGGKGVVIDYGFHASPFGIALVMATDKGVCGLGFGDEGEEQNMLADMKARWPKATYRENAPRTGTYARQIFDPRRHAGDLPLHLIGTPWQTKVWEALLAIPSGKLVTYHMIAKRIRAPKASRAVGAAVGRNPISWLIPCHRVLGSNGALTGYHWGIARKRAMLAVEAARKDQSPSTALMA